jgi:PAS domain S-box-containing protein
MPDISFYDPFYVSGLEAQVKNLKLINRFSLHLNSINILDKEAYFKICEICNEIFESTHCGIILNNEKTNDSEIVAGFENDNEEKPFWVGLKYSNNSVLGILLNESLNLDKKCIQLSDIALDDSVIDSLGYFSEIFDLKNTMVIPLVKMDIFFGFIILKVDGLENKFRKRYDELGNIVSNLLSGYFLNAKLYRKNIEIQSYLSNIIESSSDPVLSVDLEGKIFLWNKIVENVFGYKELLGKNFYYLFSSESRRKLSLEWLEVLTGRIIKNEEAIGLTQDGIKLDLRYTLSPVYGESGDIEGFSILLKDITKEKKEQQESIEHKNNLQNFFDTIPEKSIFFNKEKKIIIANKACLDYFKLTKKNIDKLNDQELVKIIKEKINFNENITTKKLVLLEISNNKNYTIEIIPYLDALENISFISVRII